MARSISDSTPISKLESAFTTENINQLATKRMALLCPVLPLKIPLVMCDLYPFTQKLKRVLNTAPAVALETGW